MNISITGFESEVLTVTLKAEEAKLSAVKEHLEILEEKSGRPHTYYGDTIQTVTEKIDAIHSMLRQLDK